MEDIKIWREEGWYIARIPALGIVDQAKTLRGLRKELKEAIELSIESILGDDLKIRGAKGNALQNLFVTAMLSELDSTISKKEKKILLAEA
ncbi:MAG: type II toxin-antitoxin system HicB family antitoxin [Candidatus Micrarchaeota archaeon]|nr:type II toxin-antitoxin system HicB family antitoxin [Candidatus Micrarchaeota archaeon]